MKKITLITAMLFTLTFFNCNTEEELTQDQSANPNFRVYESSNSASRATIDDPCTTVNLIAGQNYIAGTVTVDTDGEDLRITYSTNGDWTIQATHMSIGNCDEQWVPTTGSGNPKVGKFEHSSSHSTGVNQVVYLIDSSVLNEAYCFAAHAEVSGPTGGETAWAEGLDFGGNSWAMYKEAFLSDCELDDGGPVDPTK